MRPSSRAEPPLPLPPLPLPRGQTLFHSIIATDSSIQSEAMSRRNMSSARSNRKLVIESSTARSSEASNGSDQSPAGRRRGVRRENSSPRQDYIPNRGMYGGGLVTHRSKRLLVKSQNETSSSAIRASESHSRESYAPRSSNTKRLQSVGRGQVKREEPYLEEEHEFDMQRPMSYSGYPGHGMPPGQQLSPSQYPPSQYSPSQYPPSQYPPPAMMYGQGSYFQPPTENTYESFLSRQYQINEMQRQEELRKAEHNRRLAETQLLQQQQRDLELKNATIAREMKDEELRRQARAELLREEQDEERQRQVDLKLQQLQQGALESQNASKEMLMTNEQLLSELSTLKKMISASTNTNSSDDELLVMFSKLQVLQDILEKRDVEIDAAQLLARTFRRQSSQDVSPSLTKLRRRSSLEEKPPVRLSLSRQSSLENGSTVTQRSSVERKSFSRQTSGSSVVSKSLGRQDSRESNVSCQGTGNKRVDDSDAFRESFASIYGGDDDNDDDEIQVEMDPRILKLQHEISLLSTNILSKSFTDKTLLSLFDQLDDLKRELAVLKGIDIPFEEVTIKYLCQLVLISICIP